MNDLRILRLLENIDGGYINALPWANKLKIADYLHIILDRDLTDAELEDFLLALAKPS